MGKILSRKARKSTIAGIPTSSILRGCVGKRFKLHVQEVVGPITGAYNGIMILGLLYLSNVVSLAVSLPLKNWKGESATDAQGKPYITMLGGVDGEPESQVAVRRVEYLINEMLRTSDNPKLELELMFDLSGSTLNCALFFEDGKPVARTQDSYFTLEYSKANELLDTLAGLVPEVEAPKLKVAA